MDKWRPPVPLDEEKLDTLRHWGEGLRQASSEEQVAAGRAILMLIEEIEALRIDLEEVRRQLSRVAESSSDQPAEDPEDAVPSTLHERLQRALRRNSDSLPGIGPERAEEAGSGIESEATKSAESWIEALRRQK